MAHIETQNQPSAEFRLGLLGAGRLGQALAKTWRLRTGQAPLVWSRSGPYPAGEGTRITAGVWVKEWAGLLSAPTLVIAIPARAFRELTENNEQARQFTGNVFNAAASLSRQTLQQTFPQATNICIAPFLIDDVNSIPMLVLQPSDLAASEWIKAKSELDNFGDLDIVKDEATFIQLGLLGASWPTVVMAALQAAANAGVRNLTDETAIVIGRRIFFRAMRRNNPWTRGRSSREQTRYVVHDIARATAQYRMYVEAELFSTCQIPADTRNTTTTVLLSTNCSISLY